MTELLQPQLLGITPALQGEADVVEPQKIAQTTETKGFSDLVQTHISEYFSILEELTAATGTEAGQPAAEALASRQDFTQVTTLPGNFLPLPTDVAKPVNFLPQQTDAAEETIDLVALSAKAAILPGIESVADQANIPAGITLQQNQLSEALKQTQVKTNAAVIEPVVKELVEQVAKPVKPAVTKTEALPAVESNIIADSKITLPATAILHTPANNIDSISASSSNNTGHVTTDLPVTQQFTQTLSTGFGDASGSIMLNIDRPPLASTVSHQANNQAPVTELLPPLNMQEGDYETSFAQTVTFMVNKGMQNARLLINPPELGSIDIQLEVVDSDVKVNLITHTAAARESLDNAIPRLRELFANTDMNLLDVDVSQGGDRRSNASANEDGREHSHQSADFSLESGLLAEPASEVYSYQVRHVDGLIDAYA